MDQTRAPYLEGLLAYAQGGNLPFHTPGHMQGRGAAEDLRALLGREALKADATEVLDFDNIHRPINHTGAAQDLASELYGAARTWFLVNGSTCGNMAMLLACVGQGEEVILPRCAHRSVYAGLVLSGAVPVYASSPFDPAMGVSHAIDAPSLQALLAEHPRAKAVLFTNATPYGSIGDARSIVQLAHSAGMPVLVDEAWGPHLGFCEQLPPGALAFGADLVVHSSHKLLGALTQASMLHGQDNGLVDMERVSSVLRMLQSTSPSCLLTVSLDVARRQLALSGAKDWTRACHLASYLRQSISLIPRVPLSCLVDLGKSHWAQMLSGRRTAMAGAGAAARAAARAQALDAQAFCGCLEPHPSFAHDPTRIVIPASDFGLSGTAMERVLRLEYRVQVEMSDAQNVVLLITPAHSQEDIEQLLSCLRHLAQSRSLAKGNFDEEGAWAFKARLRGLSTARSSNVRLPAVKLKLTPREAFQARAEVVELEHSVGRICADVITPYPPGVPLLCPGELITAEHIDYLLYVHKIGVPVEGCRDAALATIGVIA